MKTNSIKLLSGATIAFSGFLLITPGANGTEKDTLNASDVNFVKHAAADDMAEVKIAELGAKKADRQDVKSFALMLVTDHTKSNEVLSKLAATKGVELSAVIEPGQAETFQKLEKSSGADFDSKFLAEMANDHEMCVNNFEKASKEATDAEVKAFANGMLPTLKAHLEKARELRHVDAAAVKTEADNTERNVRDRDGKELTPLDQGNTKSDTDITAAIRKEIVAGKDMSTNARNVKIITQNGKVTLRGPVDTAEEKQLIADIAGRIAQPDQVDCRIEVK